MGNFGSTPGLPGTQKTGVRESTEEENTVGLYCRA